MIDFCFAASVLIYRFLFSPIDAGSYIVDSVVDVALNPPVQSSHACVLQSYGEECIGWCSAFVLIN